MTAIINKYIHIGKLDGFRHLNENIVKNLDEYQNIFISSLNNPTIIQKYIDNKLNAYTNDIYAKININADINYYLENIYIHGKKKTKDIIIQNNIMQYIKLLNYTVDESLYDEIKRMYYNAYYKNIISKEYNGKTILKYIEDNWNNIDTDKLLNFLVMIRKINYHLNNTVNDYHDIIMNKYDNEENIKKLITYIKNNFIEIKDEHVNDVNDSEDKRFNFRYVLDNIKANGYLFYEMYFKDLLSRYSVLNIVSLNNELKVVRYFMTIIAQKEKTNVNRYVNEMLIKIRDYIYDLQDSYYNNANYQKIKVLNESDNYKDIDLEDYKRNKSCFKILKYNYYNETENNVLECKTPLSVSPYLAMYSSYYKSRYPDRQVQYDYVESSLIVKLEFDKIYYIHMALLQYIVLDNIMKFKDGIECVKLAENINVPLVKLNSTLNSLLKIKLIKRTMSEPILFLLNDDFTFEKNKLSIANLIKNNDKNVKEREFLHDRDMIVLCNIVNYLKKYKFTTSDTIIENISYKIPFTITNEYIERAIKKGIDDNYIKERIIDNNQIIYEYQDLE